MREEGGSFYRLLFRFMLGPLKSASELHSPARAPANFLQLLAKSACQPRKAPHRHAREAVSFSDSVQDGGKPSFRVDRPGAVLYRILFVSLTCRQCPTELEGHVRAREIQTAPLVLFTSCPPSFRQTFALKIITGVPAFFIVLSTALSPMRFSATAKLQRVWAAAGPGTRAKVGYHSIT